MCGKGGDGTLVGLKCNICRGRKKNTFNKYKALGGT